MGLVTAEYRIGKKFGYLFSYFLFTTILFYILTWLEKIPLSWTYLHIMGITIIIAVVGGLLIRWLG